MISHHFHPQAKYKIRDIRPISPHRPCYIDLHAHPYHIYNSDTFLSAFSSLECAEHSAEKGLIPECPVEERYRLIQDLKILDAVSGLEYRRHGTTWEPVNGHSVNFNPILRIVIQ